jgi:AcrR family transcriptional regulator
MGPTARRAREKENLRRAILDAARDLFESEDYHSVSIRKIADRIEYSPTAIYLYFKDKREIVLSLMQEGFHLLEQRLEAVEGDDLVSRMYRASEVYMQFALDEPKYYKLMFQVEDEELARMCVETSAGDKAFGYLVGLIVEGQQSGLVRTDIDPLLLSHSVWAAMHGVVSLVLAQRMNKLPDEMHKQFFPTLIEVVLRGIVATR